ncbi:hypothetical protein [Leptothoe spongobia]|uniref:hypothetical protein n=1 Tax=Leptothoe spongobia TaxID=2651728 RepID=UPI001C01926A|nr:hypothetical protein [Leptothoe spongobia]
MQFGLPLHMLLFPVFSFAISAIALFAIGTIILHWIWNTTLSHIFSVRRISYWEAFKLILFSKILFGFGILPFGF